MVSYHTERISPMTDNNVPEYMNIPDELNQYYLDHGWTSDYWMELPMNWNDWPKEQLKSFPITKVIYDWKKETKKG